MRNRDEPFGRQHLRRDLPPDWRGHTLCRAASGPNIKRLERVIVRAMSVDPADRFKDLREMGRELLGACRSTDPHPWSLSFGELEGAQGFGRSVAGDASFSTASAGRRQRRLSWSGPLVALPWLIFAGAVANDRLARSRFAARTRGGRHSKCLEAARCLRRRPRRFQIEPAPVVGSAGPEHAPEIKPAPVAAVTFRPPIQLGHGAPSPGHSTGQGG